MKVYPCTCCGFPVIEPWDEECPLCGRPTDPRRIVLLELARRAEERRNSEMSASV